MVTDAPKLAYTLDPAEDVRRPRSQESFPRTHCPLICTTADPHITLRTTAILTSRHLEPRLVRAQTCTVYTVLRGRQWSKYRWTPRITQPREPWVALAGSPDPKPQLQKAGAYRKMATAAVIVHVRETLIGMKLTNSLLHSATTSVGIYVPEA